MRCVFTSGPDVGLILKYCNCRKADMITHENARTDSETSEAVSKGMVILAEYGHARARTYFKEVGIRADIAERMLLIRYDRRRVSPAVARTWTFPDPTDRKG